MFYLQGKMITKQESININKTEGAWKDFPKEDLRMKTIKAPKQKKGKESPQDDGYR
jgi:hypothetical protein